MYRDTEYSEEDELSEEELEEREFFKQMRRYREAMLSNPVDPPIPPKVPSGI